jgi:hypothetical protein
MSGTPVMIAPGATHSNEVDWRVRSDTQIAATHPIPMVQGATSEWYERTQHYAAQAVANAERVQREKVEKRLDKPSRGWARVEVVRTYQANEDGERRFREEADVLELHQYVGWLETAPAGPFAARLQVETALRPTGRRPWWRLRPTRTVTWVLRPSRPGDTVS